MASMHEGRCEMIQTKTKGWPWAAAAVAVLAAPALANDIELERCDGPMGTVAVVEPQDEYMRTLRRMDLQSPTSLIRMMLQETNCLIVVERGQGMQNMMQERELARSGELRQGSNVGGGQMVTADYILSPEVVLSEGNTGGVGGAVGGLFGGSAGRVLGGVAGSLKFSEAKTTLLMADARTGVQVISAEGNARDSSFTLGALGGSGGVGGALGGYSNTSEGRVIASGFANNVNGIVNQIRANPSLQRDVSGVFGGPTTAGAVFGAGDLLHPKINNVRLLAAPGDESQVVATLARDDGMIYLGEEQDGYLAVESSHGAGWVRKLLVDN